MSDTQETIPLSPNRRGAARRVGLPFGAAEPRIYPDTDLTPLQLSNSTHSFIHQEIHQIDPFPQHVRFTDSPGPMSSQPSFFHQQLEPSNNTSRRGVLIHILRKTSPWVLAGVVIMLLGIGLLRAAVLPHIFTCPPLATCAGSLNPHGGSSVPLLQTFTVYWIKIGLMISSVGILKLTSYQAWFILMYQGNSVKNLDLNLGAIRGSITDTALLLFKKNNRLLSIFVFGLLGISAAINLIVGFSISQGPGEQSVTFTYNATTTFPSSSATQALGSDGQVKAANLLTTWALNNDQTHDGALRGTMVTPDARSTQATNALPAGPTMNAWFECQGWTNYTSPSESEWYIWVGHTRFIALPRMSLAVSMYRTDTAVTEYLWVSNRTGLIPNATTTDDGRLDIALCTHRFEMVPEAPRKPGVQYLSPTTPLTSGCDTSANNASVCVADSVNNAVLYSWGGLGTAFWYMSCRGGLLVTASPSSEEERWCPVTQELFQATASGMLDAIIQTSPTSVPAVQELQANVITLAGSRWWLNVTIPAATLVLYLIGLGYTCVLSQGNQVLKELNLTEVVRAAQTEHMQKMVSSGQLRKKTPLRYNSDIGFVDSEPKWPNI